MIRGRAAFELPGDRAPVPRGSTVLLAQEMGWDTEMHFCLVSCRPLHCPSGKVNVFLPMGTRGLSGGASLDLIFCTPSVKVLRGGNGSVEPQCQVGEQLTRAVGTRALRMTLAKHFIHKNLCTDREQLPLGTQVVLWG